MRRFHCEELGDVGVEASLSSIERSHLFRTLRAREGDRIELMDGRGTFALARVEAGERVVALERRLVAEPAVKCHLLVAAPKRLKMDQLVRECAEIGVWSITPVITARSVSVPKADGSLKRWRRLVVEGCKQSGNPFCPTLSPPICFKEARASASNGIGFFGGRSEAAVGVERLFLDDLISPGKDLFWVVGPEGGFTDGERAALRECRFTELAVGPWTERTETAAAVGAAVLVNASRWRNGAARFGDER